LVEELNISTTITSIIIIITTTTTTTEIVFEQNSRQDVKIIDAEKLRNFNEKINC